VNAPDAIAPSPEEGRIAPRPMSLVETWLRFSVGLAYLGLVTGAFMVLLFFCLPSRPTRIKLGNVYGTWAGRGICLISGSKVRVRGHEEGKTHRPCIYVANHTAVMDVFIGIWLSPIGACGIAKKEIVRYPFFGQMFWLAGHLVIDRTNRETAVASLRALAPYVLEHGLSIWIWPEGTRSRDGRLKPFKKGVGHLALATGLPVVPIVIAGAQHAWHNDGMRLEKADIDVQFLDPIPTTDWREETLDLHLKEVERVYERHLPPEQRPLPPTT
jgi:1-acyl-sn-glycerol-3-phosphate acyltransferase